MRPTITLLLLCSVFLFFNTHASSIADGATEGAQAHTVELVGILRRPMKSSPYIDLRPTNAGQEKRMDVKGDLLRDIKEGKLIHVRGIVHTRLHKGGRADNPSPIPTQWFIWLDVSELAVLDDDVDITRVVGD